MKYQLLTDSEKESVLQNTIRNVEAEHFAETLALIRVEAMGDEEQMKAVQARMEKLEAQHKTLVESAK